MVGMKCFRRALTSLSVAFALLQMALAVQDSLRERGLPALPGRDIRMRIALHCGPAIAGIVGIKSNQNLVDGHASVFGVEEHQDGHLVRAAVQLAIVLPKPHAQQFAC